MGGDDSQKLLPWRGMILLSGAQTSGSFRLQHCSGKLRGRELVAHPRGSATDGLGYFWQADLGQFSRAPKQQRCFGHGFDSCFEFGI
jgi:hypothetical protein